MSIVTLRIEPYDAALAGFPVALLEDGQETGRGLLAASALTQGTWVLPRVGDALQAGQRSVLAPLSLAANARDQVDWAGAARALFEWLVPAGPVRARWPAAANAASAELYLDIHDDELAALPWELACTPPPERRPAIINGLSRLHPPVAAASTASAWPLRLLVIVGCAPEEEAELGIADEIAQIERRFLRLGRSVDVHCLRRPSKLDLVAHLKPFPPHVLHFAGHGVNDPLTDVPGLAIETAGDPWIWKSDDLVTDLAATGLVPRFVFLNACRSAVAQAGSLSVQRSFVSAGAAAVLAMQADVRGDLAGRFAADLYERVAAGATLQQAVREARRSLATALGSYTPVDWALPSLTATEPALTLFSPIDVPKDDEFERCHEFEEARYFANCRAERRVLTHWIYPASADPGANVAILSGPRQSGKSHLLKWCMETWAIGGARVRYVELHSGAARDFLSVVRQIRDGDDAPVERRFLRHPLPPSAFRRFNWELNNRLSKGQPGEWIATDHPDPEIADEMLAMSAKGERRPEPAICAALLDALSEVATDRPLVLVFDQLGGPNGERLVDPDGFEQLIRHLFRPIADRTDHRIRLVFAVTPDEFTAYRLHLLPNARVHQHKLPGPTDAALVPYAAEMFWFQDEQLVQQLAQVLLNLHQNMASPVGLGRLSLVFNSLRGDAARMAIVERMR